ncbi:MAG TPA: TetR/AcrR family transcriptional regulator [Candidatus Sulfotelmatobacter sp.]|nr:TetR/AcrR family transcriptional regulator [Candidatus Sulfotelmatobacter sp.]
MRDYAEVLRRSRGRPQIRPDSETLQLIFEAARQEFQALGYAGTSMNAVARRAGVSTKTMYRLIPTKAELFQRVLADRIERFLLALDLDALDRLPLQEALERMLRTYGELTLSEDTISITRLVIGECHRFPELATSFHTTAIVQTREAMAAWLERQCRRGQVAPGDPALAAEALRGMMIMEPQRGIMLGKGSIPDAAAIAARAKYCAQLFLQGCGVSRR